MRRLLLIAVIAGSLLLAGCTGTETENVVSTPNSMITYVGNQTTDDLAIGFGVSCKVELDDVYAGWSDTVPITIVNGHDRDRMFIVSVYSPYNPAEGFEPLPEEYLCWITLSPATLNIPAGSNSQVFVTVSRPKDTDYDDKSAEFRILVEDTTQTGLIQIATESRWFITTAK